MISSAEWRIARRETRAALKKFLFAMAAVAVGVAALTGVQGFGLALKSALLKQARQLIAADLAVRLSSLPSEEEQKVFDRLTHEGAQIDHATETVSMISTMGLPPLLVAVKAVEPARYPLYGNIVLDNNISFNNLTPKQMVVTPDVLLRLNVEPGAVLQLGVAVFEIAAVLVSEPDRLASGFQLGPRVLLSRQGIERAGLIRPGSRAAQIFHIKLPANGVALEGARRLLRESFGIRARLVDYRDPNPRLSRGLERTTTFLSLVSLIALLIGAVGVAMTIHAYIQQKLDTIAILKCLGARSRQIMAIYLLEGMLIGLGGSLLGILLGYGVQIIFPRFLGGLLEIPTEIEWAPWAALQGLAVGVSVTMLLLLLPLLKIRKIRPALIFRRHMQEVGDAQGAASGGAVSWRRRAARFVRQSMKRLRSQALALLVAVATLGGIGTIAGWLAGSWRRGFGFLGALLAVAICFALLAQLLLGSLKRLPRLRSLSLRHGLANLHRPGSQALSVLVAMSLGVALTSSIYLIQSSLLAQIMRSLPADFPNLFILGVSAADRDPLWNFLSSHPAVIDAAKPVAATPARVVSIDGKDIESVVQGDRDSRPFARMEFTLTWSERPPPDTHLIEGSWWSAQPASPLISVGQEAARVMKLRLGSVVEFNAGGKPLVGRVANIRENDSLRPGSNNQFIFSPGSLENMPTTYVGNVRVRPEGVRALQKDIFDRFPTFTTVNVDDVLGAVQKLIGKIALVIQFVSAFALLAGTIVLISTIASSRYRRIRETALLKALGARRSDVVRIHAVEFATVGLVAGLVGSAFAAAIADWLLGHQLEVEYDLRWLPLAVSLLASVALTLVTGWLATRDLLGHRPLEVLREE